MRFRSETPSEPRGDQEVFSPDQLNTQHLFMEKNMVKMVPVQLALLTETNSDLCREHMALVSPLTAATATSSAAGRGFRRSMERKTSLRF